MNILIAYYSLYGHTLQLAKAVRQGASFIAGTEAILRRIAEFPEIEKDLKTINMPKRSGTSKKTSLSAL